MKYPKVSIVTPTLNAGLVLEDCLSSVANQSYPKEKIEIIIADGGSTDTTINISNRYGAKVVYNKLKTGESGKAIGVKSAMGEFIVLLDSDNILPDSEWLLQMIEPLLIHEQAVGSEPWSYTLRKSDGFITRYCALIGMNDPLVHFLGNYDRLNLLSGKWTEVKREEEDYGNYLVVKFKHSLPTIGANGTVFRAKYLKKQVTGDYLFDIDILAKTIKMDGSVTFIKVKNGIVHTFCESDIRKFSRKQQRRIKDYLYHQNVTKDREYEWQKKDLSEKSNLGLLKFIFYCITFFPLLLQAFKGYTIRHDLAWFFHPLACEITLWEYSKGRLLSIFNNKELDRSKWKQ